MLPTVAVPVMFAFFADALRGALTVSVLLVFELWRLRRRLSIAFVDRCWFVRRPEVGGLVDGAVGLIEIVALLVPMCVIRVLVVEVEPELAAWRDGGGL